MPKKEKFDVIIVGGGTGGLRAAMALARKKKTAVVDPGVLGGTCLNNGCIPTKAMLEASHLFERAKSAKEFGIMTSGVKVNFKKLMARVTGIIQEGQDHIKKGLKKSPLTVVRARGKFVEKNVIKAGSRLLTAPTIIIAVGADNWVPPIKGIDKVPSLDNTTLVKLKTFPKTVVMIGGGYISMEFAAFFNELGSKVTVLERLPTTLGMLDEDVHHALVDQYEDRGMKIYTNVNILETKKKGKKVQVVCNDVRDEKSRKTTLTFDAMVVATGRLPNTKNLGLDDVGIKHGPRGHILIDDKMRTNVKGVYAVGDCTDKPMFAHAAKREVNMLLENLFGNKKAKVDYSLVPWAVFTHPPVSGVGLSEKQCLAQKKKFDVYKAPMSRAGRTRIIGEQEGFVKVMVERKSGNILGASIVGVRADDMIHEFAAVMNSKEPKFSVIQKTIHVHPTVSEVMESLKKVR